MAVVEATARVDTVVVEVTSRVVEEVMVDREDTSRVVVEDTSRVVDTVVVDTEHCSTAALASSACWVWVHCLVRLLCPTCSSRVSVQQCFLFIDSCKHVLLGHACSSCRAKL